MDLITEYLELGLSLGEHIDGFVDAYYGPPLQVATVPPAALVAWARSLLAELEVDGSLEPARRHWLAAQVRGLHTTASKLAGDSIGYLDEIKAAYGVRPHVVEEDVFAEAHRQLDSAIPGSGSLAERYIEWREAQTVPPTLLESAVGSLAEDFRERTARLFGLPEAERIDFVLVDNKPWSGFNYYLGDLCSRVAINIDLPVMSLTLGHLIAHEAYPGHHTEHCRKEAGLVLRRRQLEETIFLVGTPQCLIAEGLADLGLEIICGVRPEPVVAEHLRPLGIPYDADVAAEVASAAEVLGSVRGNAAILVHEQGLAPEQGVDYIERWALTTRARAEKALSFVMDPTWRAYPFCYIDGIRLCRAFVRGDPARFERLITDQLTPSQLVAAGSGET
jgi:hypothetical protein